MYKPANPWKSYRQIATQTAPPGQLILMLYDGALNYLEHAKAAFTNPELGERNVAVHNNLQKAVNIIRELNSALNLEAGGDLASTLRDLYLYFESRILESNLKKHPGGLDEVSKHIKELRDAWSSMLAKENPHGAAAAESKGDVWINPDMRAA
jgi:flagellar protein FliS